MKEVELFMSFHVSKFPKETGLMYLMSGSRSEAEGGARQRDSPDNCKEEEVKQEVNNPRLTWSCRHSRPDQLDPVSVI